MRSSSDYALGQHEFSSGSEPWLTGRNTGLGPDLYQLDCRLSREFRIKEKASLSLLAEAFNIANRTNYASVNNVVGAAFGPPFNAQGSSSLSPSQPLGFTSDLPKRQYNSVSDSAFEALIFWATMQ